MWAHDSWKPVGTKVARSSQQHGDDDDEQGEDGNCGGDYEDGSSNHDNTGGTAAMDADSHNMQQNWDNSKS